MRNPWVRSVVLMLVVLSVAAAEDPQMREVSLRVGSAIIGDLKGNIAKGEISVHSPQGAPVEPQRGLTLAPESVIETTKGSVLLNLQDGSQVLVRPHSRVVLKAPTEGKGYFLELWLGKIFAQVQKRFGNAPSFKMGTPTAVITVRGTRFSVEVTKKKKTVVDVYEGLVAVSGVDAVGTPVLLQPGFWTEVGSAGSPEEPRERFNPGEISDRMERNFGQEDDNPFGEMRGGQGQENSGNEVERETSTPAPKTPSTPSNPKDPG